MRGKTTKIFTPLSFHNKIIYQLIGSKPILFSISFVFEKCLQPKKPA